jgi:hypothetical protein
VGQEMRTRGHALHRFVPHNCIVHNPFGQINRHVQINR